MNSLVIQQEHLYITSSLNFISAGYYRIYSKVWTIGALNLVHGSYSSDLLHVRSKFSRAIKLFIFNPCPVKMNLIWDSTPNTFISISSNHEIPNRVSDSSLLTHRSSNPCNRHEQIIFDFLTKIIFTVALLDFH